MPVIYNGTTLSEVFYNGTDCTTVIYNGTTVFSAQRFMYAFGQGSYGALGLGSTSNSSTPAQVGSNAWSSLAAGNSISAGVQAGRMFTWGQGALGSLGFYAPPGVNYSSPRQLGALTNWSSVGNSASAMMAIKTNGTLWGWGFNTSGQLGNGNTTNQYSPVQIGSLTNWAKIVGGGGYSNFFAGIKTDGTLWMWGQNNNGQLGLGNTTNRSSPVQVGSLTNWRSVSVGSLHTMAIKTDGTLWAWGSGGSGELGLGNLTSYSSPKQIGALTSWSAVSSGQARTFAVRTNGTLWGWGLSALGPGSNASSPVQIGTDTNWKFVNVSTGSTQNRHAIKTDGTLWGWGANNYGILGRGYGGYQSSPVPIGSATNWSFVVHGNRHNLARVV